MPIFIISDYLSLCTLIQFKNIYNIIINIKIEILLKHHH